MKTEEGNRTKKNFLWITLPLSQPDSPVNTASLVFDKRTSTAHKWKLTSLYSKRVVLPLWLNAAADLGVERNDFITKYIEWDNHKWYLQSIVTFKTS